MGELSLDAVDRHATTVDLPRARDWWNGVIITLARSNFVRLGAMHVFFGRYPLRSAALMKTSADLVKQARKAASHPPAGWELVGGKLSDVCDRLERADRRALRLVLNATMAPGVVPDAESREAVETIAAIDETLGAAHVRYAVDGGHPEDLLSIPNAIDRLAGTGGVADGPLSRSNHPPVE